MAARAEKAVEYKKQGMNCAQAVACAFADVVNVDEDTLLAMTQAMGAGIGATMEGTCGAVTGACMIVGLAEKDGKAAAMKKGGRLLRAFQQQNQSVVCKELKGIGTGVVLRSCNDCVKDAAELLEDIITVL